MYRIEYIRASFLSLSNDRSGPRSGRGARCAPVRYRWILGSNWHTTGGLTSLESYGPRFSIPPGRGRVMSVSSRWQIVSATALVTDAAVPVASDW